MKLIMSIIILLIVWTWGITPLWVNITISGLLWLYFTLKVLLFFIEEDERDD